MPGAQGRQGRTGGAQGTFRAGNTLADTAAVGACRCTRPAPQSVTPRVNAHVTCGLGLPTMQPHRLSRRQDGATLTRDGNAGGTGGGRGGGVFLATVQHPVWTPPFFCKPKIFSINTALFFFFFSNLEPREDDRGRGLQPVSSRTSRESEASHTPLPPRPGLPPPPTHAVATPTIHSVTQARNAGSFL